MRSRSIVGSGGGAAVGVVGSGTIVGAPADGGGAAVDVAVDVTKAAQTTYPVTIIELYDSFWVSAAARSCTRAGPGALVVRGAEPPIM